jgi:hypothetical protein
MHCFWYVPSSSRHMWQRLSTCFVTRAFIILTMRHCLLHDCRKCQQYHQQIYNLLARAVGHMFRMYAADEHIDGLTVHSCCKFYEYLRTAAKKVVVKDFATFHPFLQLVFSQDITNHMVTACHEFFTTACDSSIAKQRADWDLMLRIRVVIGKQSEWLIRVMEAVISDQQLQQRQLQINHASVMSGFERSLKNL